MKKTEKTSKKSRKNKIKWIKTIMVCAVIVLTSAYVVLLEKSVDIMANSAYEAYQDAEQDTYDKFYQASADYYEKKNHVKNRATIYVEQVRETAELEVLNVSDVEYVVRDDYWIPFTGSGVFTVNLKEAEFIVDNERSYVIVRVPSPKLSLDLTSVVPGEKHKLSDTDTNVIEKLVSSINNGSSSEGIDTAREDIAEGQAMIEENLRSTQLYDTSARTSAESIISELVKNFNPDVEELDVDVEFTD